MMPMEYIVPILRTIVFMDMEDPNIVEEKMW